MGYDWDENKNEKNKKKHGVSFEEAVSVFEDPDADIYREGSGNFDEERFRIVGWSSESRELFIIYCERTLKEDPGEEDDDFYENETIRIISARVLTSQDKKRLGRL